MVEAFSRRIFFSWGVKDHKLDRAKASSSATTMEFLGHMELERLCIQFQMRPKVQFVRVLSYDM